MSMHKNQSGIAHLAIILSVLLVSVAGFTGWRLYESSTKDQKENTNTSTERKTPPVEQKQEASKTPDGYAEYVNTEFGFSFTYPKDWGDIVFSKGLLGDPATENGEGYRGEFAKNEFASFALRTKDWEYTGPGRGGPDYALGFNTYEKVKESDIGDTGVIKFSTDSKQLYAYTTNFNITGAIVSANQKFSQSHHFAGIQFSLSVPSDLYPEDFENANPSADSIVTQQQFEQMETMLASVKEL